MHNYIKYFQKLIVIVDLATIRDFEFYF